MKDLGFEGVVRGKKTKATIPDKTLPCPLDTTLTCPLDKVKRQPHAPIPNVLWISNFTYVAKWPHN